MSSISHNNIARAIYASFQGKSEAEQTEVSRKVVDFLDKKRLLSKAPMILAKLNQIINEEEGRMEAKVYTARAMSENARKELESAIGKKYGGKQIIIKEHLDEKILGGYRIEIKDEVIDLSLQNKIKKLQEHLTHSI